MISSVSQEIDHHDNELLQTDTANAENPATPQSPTFENIISRQSHKSESQMSRISESTTTQSVKRTSVKTRRKGPLKLRFHHQALPAEYLNHYESQQKLESSVQSQQKSTTRRKLLSKPSPPSTEKANGEVKMNNESIISWLQNILELQNIDEPKAAPKVRNIPIEVAPTSSRTQCLKDLPYMGEMTLENMKPRRGRKPKKADICHLIYKNYGTIVPGSTASTTTTSITTSTNVRKTAEHSKKKPSPLPLKKIKESNEMLQESLKPRKKSQNEPLNLCTRERKVHREETSILISDDNDDSIDLRPPFGRSKALIEPCETDSIDLEFSSTIPSLISPLDLSGDLPATSKEFFRTTNITPPLSSSTSTPTTPSMSGGPPGYVYWPSAGLFVHPMALYYQKMMDGKLNQDSSTSSSTSSLSSMLNSEANAIWEQNMLSCGIDLKNPDFDMENFSQLIKSETCLNSPPPALAELLKNTKLDSKKPAAFGQSSNNLLQKRKRSAIFIPPVQTETSATNPTNEVSICKFKFTGGAKPSLQEKKILSVDAGGNFRYFSGTGDKSMRGYEFFPRESLRQSSLASGSHTNAFLNAASEKIPLDLLPPISNDLNNKLLNLSTELVDSSNNNFAIEPENIQTRIEKGDDRTTSSRKKKSSNRSIQRAKLEKTFKEKGFLIQTQQLQSAEGATYCKFRQLRKFTRYLFRSWKDYLPTDENAPRPVEKSLLESPDCSTANSP